MTTGVVAVAKQLGPTALLLPEQGRHWVALVGACGALSQRAGEPGHCCSMSVYSYVQLLPFSAMCL